MKGLSPLDKLRQGFSYVSDEEGKTVSSVESVEEGACCGYMCKMGLLRLRLWGRSVWNGIRRERTDIGGSF